MALQKKNWHLFHLQWWSDLGIELFPVLPVVTFSNGKRRFLEEGFSSQYESWISVDKVWLVIDFTSLSTQNYWFFWHELRNVYLYTKSDVHRGE